MKKSAAGRILSFCFINQDMLLFLLSLELHLVSQRETCHQQRGRVGWNIVYDGDICAFKIQKTVVAFFGNAYDNFPFKVVGCAVSAVWSVGSSKTSLNSKFFMYN